jgi:predicted Zn-dependent protease
MNKKIFLLFIITLISVPSYADQEGLLKILKEELARNKENLKFKDYESPYFISYQLKETESFHISAKNGALFSDNYSRNRNLYVDVRVGDYQFDSSEGAESYFGMFPEYIPSFYAPIEDDSKPLKRALWLLTDYKYKQALQNFLKLKGKKIYEVKKNEFDSFSREEPVTYIEKDEKTEVFNRDFYREMMKKLSSKFLDYKDLFDSNVDFSTATIRKYMVNTEGTTLMTSSTYYSVVMIAFTRAEDGMLLSDSVNIYARTVSQIPPFEKIEKQLMEMANNLVAMRNAKLLEPLTVPAILMPEATGVFFHETIGHRLEGQRQEDKEEGRTFKESLGKKILPDFIDIMDDPTLQIFNGIPLNGHYKVDDEGVMVQKVTLVEKGVLKNFLMSRKPIEKISKSNGHGRSDGYLSPVSRMGVLYVKSSKSFSMEKLKQMLLAEAKKQNKPFGLIIYLSSGGSTNTSLYGYQAYKSVPRLIYKLDVKTGKEELVRGLELVGTPLLSLNKIIASSNEYGVFNGYCGAESGTIPVSTIAPAVLLSEMEFQRTKEMKEKGQILPPP